MTNDQKVETPREAEDDYADNVIPFRRPATGGSGTPPGTGSNWLAGFEVGQRFFAKRKGTAGSELDEFVVAARIGGDIVLIAKNIHGMGDFTWHEQSLFSHDYRLILSLEVVNENNKQIPSERMDSDEEAEVEPGVHEGE